MGTMTDNPGDNIMNVIARVGYMADIEGGVEQLKLVLKVEKIGDDWDHVLSETVYGLGQGGLVPSGSGLVPTGGSVGEGG